MPILSLLRRIVNAVTLGRERKNHAVGRTRGTAAFTLPSTESDAAGRLQITVLLSGARIPPPFVKILCETLEMITKRLQKHQNGV